MLNLLEMNKDVAVRERLGAMIKNKFEGKTSEEVSEELRNILSTAQAVLIDLLPEGLGNFPYRQNITADIVEAGTRYKLLIAQRKHDICDFRFSTVLLVEADGSFNKETLVDFLEVAVYEIAEARLSAHNAKVLEDALATVLGEGGFSISLLSTNASKQTDIVEIVNENTVVLGVRDLSNVVEEGGDLVTLVSIVNKLSATVEQQAAFDEKYDKELEAYESIPAPTTEEEEALYEARVEPVKETVETDLTLNESALLNKIIEDATEADNLIVYLTNYKGYLHPYLVEGLGKIAVQNIRNYIRRGYPERFDKLNSVKTAGKASVFEAGEPDTLTLYERKEKGGDVEKVVTIDLETGLYV